MNVWRGLLAGITAVLAVFEQWSWAVLGLVLGLIWQVAQTTQRGQDWLGYTCPRCNYVGRATQGDTVCAACQERMK